MKYFKKCIIGIYCLKDGQNLPCCPAHEKGRSIGMEIPSAFAQKLCRFYKPFDEHLLTLLDLDWKEGGVLVDCATL
jgi:hypothetical protein